MKKLSLFFITLFYIVTLIGCTPETVLLKCDGDGCDNSVEIEKSEDIEPDDSWIVFCQDCADNVLDD